MQSDILNTLKFCRHLQLSYSGKSKPNAFYIFCCFCVDFLSQTFFKAYLCFVDLHFYMPLNILIMKIQEISDTFHFSSIYEMWFSVWTSIFCSKKNRGTAAQLSRLYLTWRCTGQSLSTQITILILSSFLCQWLSCFCKTQKKKKNHESQIHWTMKKIAMEWNCIQIKDKSTIFLFLGDT